MMGSAPIFIYYYIPEDQETVDEPNVFPLCQKEGSPKEIKLKTVKDQFPLAGEYHFRFRIREDGGCGWLDITNDESFVPYWEDRYIFMKVQRVSWNPVEPPVISHNLAEDLGATKAQVTTSDFESLFS